MSIEILIVDDNADIRNIINELILDTGYKTRVAANYNQALAEIDKRYFINKELHLKTFDGLPTLKKLEILSSTLNLPISKHEEIFNRKQEYTHQEISLLNKDQGLIDLFNLIKVYFFL